MNDLQLGCTSLVTHMVNTDDHMTIKQQPYHTPIVHKQALAKIIDDMQDQGHVRSSSSHRASLVVLVPKKHGSLCFWLIIVA